MKIDCISDLHGHRPILEGGDLLIICGDLTWRDSADEYLEFNDWLKNQDYEKKIVIAGNHDGFLEREQPDMKYFTDACYLEDSGTEYSGLKIWGSPWTPEFYDWYFMKKRGEELKQVWDQIPDDTDILVTHGPPVGILDEVKTKKNRIKHTGDEDLRIAVLKLKPRLHVFGHIHEGYGTKVIGNTTFVNACLMNNDYQPINKPIRINL